MRYLVISDLHSNWEALQTVAEAARGLYEKIVCLGDLAGYGPDPNRVIEWVRENVSSVIRGNHDRACAGFDDLEWFNPVARAATIWTMSQLTPANREYLESLPRGPLMVDDFQLIHGSPLDEDEYVMSLMDARNVFSYVEANVNFFGHTHLQGAFVHLEGRYEVLARPESSESGVIYRLDPDAAYLINPGSCGQPRDHDPRAGWAIFDSGARELELHRTPYNCEATRAKIEAAGLPEVLGLRLSVGR